MTSRITEAVYAVPYPIAPTVWIAFPSLTDWKHFLMPAHDKAKAKDVRWLQHRYDQAKQAHEDDVRAQLRVILGFNTGRTILQMFRLRSGHSVLIFPFALDDNPGTTIATAVPLDDIAATATRAPLLDREGKPSDKKIDRARRGTGAGSGVDVFYSNVDARSVSQTDETSDEVLLHELVHAVRMVFGVRHRRHTVGGYHNEEEFLSVLVVNMYRSEKHRPIMDYRHDRINTKTFLHRVFVNPTEIIARLRQDHPDLFAALLTIRAPFNPVAQYFDEL
jgi:hypothetical protein